MEMEQYIFLRVVADNEQQSDTSVFKEHMPS